MTQKKLIEDLLKNGSKSINDLVNESSILRPNIRRILGTGAKEGTFERLDKGVYTLKTQSKISVIHVDLGLAQEILPRLIADGCKYDMVFLDPAYYSPNLVGRNKKPANYNFIMPEDFAKVMQSVAELVRWEDSHIYLMLSGAVSTQKDMNKYLDAALSTGLKFIGEGHYKKLYSNGNPFLNIRGEISAPERLILLSKNGQFRPGEKSLDLEYSAVRPSSKKSYSTEKPIGLIDPIILQSTLITEEILDPFAGSGVVGERSVVLGRRARLIESSESVIETHICKKLLTTV